jgi:hypothetical protein
MKQKVKELLEKRDDLSYRLIEAQRERIYKIQDEIRDIEDYLELSTGKSIEQLEYEFYSERI